MEDYCKDAQKIVSKFGYTLTCPEDETKEEKIDIILPASDICDDIVEVVSKYGVKAVCEDQAWLI